MHKKFPDLKSLLGINSEDEQEIQRHRAALQSYHPHFHRNVRQWADEYELVKAGQEPLLDGFFDAIIGGTYDEHFQATLHRQALHWHHLQLNEDRILLLLSRIWQELLRHSESLGSPQLPRSLCLVVEMARIIAIRTVSLSRKMWAIKERAEHDTARIHQAFSLLAANLPDDLVQAYADHQQWMYTSISLLLGEQPAVRVPGSSECNLARWLAAGGRALIPAAQWEEFDAAHHKVHELVDTIVTMADQERSEDVYHLLHELEGATAIVGRTLLQCIDESITRFASYDPLTTLRNRSTLKSIFQRELALASRFQKNVGAILLDIDHFKKINDKYGHLFGDQVLIELSQCLTKQIRQEDALFRWGGEEFLIIGLTESSPPDNIRLMAERIRRAVENTVFCQNTQTPVRFTVSAGVVEFNPAGKMPMMDSIFEHADKLLYQAKQTGRNKVVSEFLDAL